MTFTQEFKTLVDQIGVGRSAKILGITERTTRRWYYGYTPLKPTCAGALALLRFELIGQDIISTIRSRKTPT